MAISNPEAFARPAASTSASPTSLPQRPRPAQAAVNILRPIGASPAVPPTFARGLDAAARGAAHVGQQRSAAINPLASDVPRLPTQVVRPSAKSGSGRTLGYGATWDMPRPAQPPSAQPGFKGVMSDAEIAEARTAAIPNPGTTPLDRVQVFSDGTGGIERTMTPAQIENLGRGDRLTEVPSATFARPAPGVAASMATGGETLALGAGPIQRPTTFPRQPVSAVRAAQLDAQHDMADIASGNMLSAQGRAASNLRRRGDPASQAQLDAMMANAGAGVPLEAQTVQTRMQEQGATQRTAMSNATDLAREQMAGEVNLEQVRLQRPQSTAQIQMADGTLGLLGQDGTVRTATMPDGSPVRPAVPRQRRSISGGEARLLTDIVNTRLGLDPQTGMMIDPEDKKTMRAPTAQEFQEAMTFAQQQLDSFSGNGVAAQPAAQPSDAAAQFLRQDASPEARAEFDQKYGAGSAARILGS